MAQKNRTKEVWLIPKRVNLHQTICLIDGILERNYDRTSWNPQKQNNLGVNLKKWGATRDGKNISSQAIRTLVASIPQYLGFVYINTETTPNTICLTDAGRRLWDQHKGELEKVPNLAAAKDQLIQQSSVVLRQMEKLQITNPVIHKDCENIAVFPFRFMLRLLLEVGYLDQEEIAYFLFQVGGEDEIDALIREITDFRKLPEKDRENLMNAFKKTHVGNITLVKAPSAGYYISLCQATGIIDRFRMTPDNLSREVTALKIKEDDRPYVEDMLKEKYRNANVYDFGDNLQLWMDYIGNPDRDYPPVEVNINNPTKKEYLIQVIKDGVQKYDDLVPAGGSLRFPMFVKEVYQIQVLSVETGAVADSIEITPDFDKREFALKDVKTGNADGKESFEELAAQISEHLAAKDFAGKTLHYLGTLKKVTGVDKTTDKSLRGAYLEFYFYKLLTVLEREGMIDEVTWNGKTGRYGLPIQAPGGVAGTPDMIFQIQNIQFVLELTTIKPKSLQFRAEGSSVPDHVRLYRQTTKKEVIGIFCAPVIHSRNTAAMQSVCAGYGIDLKCMTHKDFIGILRQRDAEKIKASLKLWP